MPDRAPFTFTMRGIILALVLTLVGSQKLDIDPGFSSRRIYLYNYEGFMLNGLQERGLGKAGVRLSSKLEISGLSENAFLLKVRSPQVEEYNGVWPRDPFTRSSKITQAVSSCFTRPFKFEYSSGRVGSIYAPEDCPDLCVNIVRGILNMLQITIKKSQNVYELQEAGIGGICHTRYIIQEDRKNSRVSVTKTVDQNNCQEKVQKSVGMAYIYPCPVDMMKERLTKGTAAFSYKLKQSDSGTLITEVASQQVYQISPFSEPTGVAVMEARQQLTLLEVRSERGSAPDVPMQSYGSLRYHFPAELPQMPLQLIKTKNPEQRIVETLQHIVLNNQQDFHDDVPYRFLELVQLCRIASSDALESVWRQVSDKPRYRRWLLSAVSASGTTEALKFLKTRIRNDDLNYIQTLLTVSLTLHLMKADEHTLPIAADLMTSSRIQKNPMLQQVACLGYSSVVNRYCSQTSACPKEALQPIHDLADEAISRGREDKMKLALKCIGNMGEPASLKRVLKFLPISSSSASDIPIHIQIDAIMALRKIAWKDPKTVQGYLIQILADQSLPPEVRMMACAVIFETRPALAMITTIANIAMKESNLQVASFVYSHMKSLSKSRLPFMYNISSACNIALKLLAPKLDRLSNRYSKVIRAGSYFDNYRVGAAGEIFVMNSPETMFPSAIISKLMANSAGSVADLVEVGIRVEGLTDVIMKRNIPFAEYPTYKKIKELGKALLGWKELPTETPLISAYLKILGQEMAFISINREVLQQAMKTILEPADRNSAMRRIASQIRNGITGQWTQPVWMGELRYMVPSCLGLPLEYGSYTTALARAAVSVDGKMTPPLTGDFRLSQLLESTMQIRSDLNPSLYVHTVATMGVNTEYFQHVVEIQGELQTRMPMKFDAKIDMKLKNVKIETNPCREETEIMVGRRSRDASFIKNTYLHRLIGEHEAKLVLMPVHTDADIDKIQLEIQAGSRAASKIINEVNSASEEENESSPYEDIQAKLKKILGIENVFKPKFLGDTKTPVLAAFLHGISNSKKTGGLQLVVYADTDSVRPRMQVFVTNLTDSSKWKLCADASVLNAHKAAAYLKWGRNCQDYKVSTELVTGRFAGHPAAQVKLEWPKVPSSVRSVVGWFYRFVPGAAFMLGFSERMGKNPSRQARMVVALTSPRTCDIVVKLPDMTLYQKAMRLPLSLPVGPRIPASELQPPIWNVFAEAPSAVLENLKARCLVSHNKITTFNEVKFNYSMPASCYHILAQDCSSDLKFLVMMKGAEGATNLKTINVKIGNHEIDMHPVNGQVKLLVDGAESPTTNISLVSAGASLWIHSENQGLVLVAPAYGIDKLYFDGQTFSIQVALWMAGKMCGICGKYDAECEQEYRMPNRYLAKDAVSFGHSWILEETPCRGACKLHRSFVKLEKTVQLAGVDSKCYSTEPVLRCMKGCSATKTTPVTVGFHCLPAGAQKHDLEPGFRTGKTYVYDYEGLILHRLPGKGLVSAGLMLTCGLEISRVSRSDHLLQIRSPKLEEYHGFWPSNPFTPSPKLTETIAACFSRVFKFEYTEGRVGSIYAPEDCPILCTNLVRGILNMMQITIKKSQNVYNLQEAGIEGICQTRYVIQDDSKNNRATISKSRDLTDCQDSAVKSTGMAYIRPCPTCPMKVRNMKGTALFTYKMKYYDSGALVTFAMSEQVYQISPFNEPDGTAAMEAKQELVLVDIKSTPIKAPDAQLQNQGSLRYHFPEGLLQIPIPLIRVKNADTQLTETLQQLVQNDKEGGTTEASTKFLQMVQLLRVVTLDQIESVWMQFASEPPYRHWFLSAVCAAGATDTFQFLKQKIHDKNLNVWEGAVVLPLAFHSVMPSKKTLEVASPLHDLAAEASSRSHVEDMALALKAIGNAGEPASIKRVLKFLPTFSVAAASLPSRIHADAVLALRKIARKDLAKVREITLQIFMDSTLAPNVRMTACIVLFETKPSLPIVAAMASSLLRETSLQVASFTYSHMKALAVGGIPQLYNLSAACNIAIKLLSPRLGRLSYRYSKVMHAGGYSYLYKAGAIWRVYLLNSPNTMFPSDIITKVRGYYANTATDIVEVALRSQSLTNIIRRQNIPFAEYDTYKTLKELGKMLLGWKELPPEDPAVSAYFKVLGQEIAFIDIDNGIIQQAMKSLTGSSSWQTAVKRAVEEAQRGVSGQWALPAVVAELRHVVPTVVGLPLELSMCSAALAQAAAAVDIQMSPPLSDNFRPSQLLETNMDIHADIKPKVYFHMVAMMGTNTQYLQSGLELHAEFSANTSMKFDARINMKEKNVKIETLPCHQEVELAAVRSEAFAISRNMEEVDSEKKSPIVPKGEMPTISNQQFQSSEIWKQRDIPSVISRGHLQGSEEEHHHRARQTSYARIFCRKLASLGCSACLSLKSRNSAFLRNTWLNKLVGELEAKIVLKPVHTDADIEKIQLEIQAGDKAASKIIDATRSGPKEEKEPSLYENIKAKLKKILGIENVFKADVPIYQFWFKPADEQNPRRKVQNSSISSSSSSSSNEGISTPMSQPKFLGDSKPPILAAVLHAIKRNEQPTGYQLVMYTDRQAPRLRMQMFVSSITESNRWKLCADASVINSHKASGTLKWGKDCQDYQVATQIATGQFAAHPAIQVKLEWSKVPSSVRNTARWFYTYLPGAAYMLGYSQKQQRGPSHQAAVVMALTSPRTCDVVLKLPELTVYNRAIRLPLPLPSSQDTPTSTLPSSDWNVFYQAAFSVIENLKARCLVSQNTITTFNGVEFNYSMPANCYHILAQDCSPELKFLVMMKRLEESADLTAISVRLASHEVDMYVSNGLIQLKINGVQTPTDVPYSSKSGLLISGEKEGLSLKAPEYGVEKLYYDGHKLEIRVAFWMVGKTCGICGKYDAEKKMEYQMPSRYLAKDAVSFAHSWVISEDTCTGACKLQRKFVKIEKPVAFDKKASKCFSVEPVLRCAEGCSATRTVPVSVGFHCVPSDSTLEPEEEQVRLDQKSEDLVSRVDAHTACSCAQQLCSA
ncbi:hypothetical protein ASZ78_012898 [Callipepla squamata]|uniref:Uncharacterized protein n=1 Tax=Callipepla squamata TaxID=9009 RepID=A0A226MJH0_CALSU|nr:hypothetical protein ASZ78_012898 [Callipepla squamata]